MGRPRVWDAANGKELLSFKGHSGSVWSLAFLPDGQRIVTGSLIRRPRCGRRPAARNCSPSKRRCDYGAFAVLSPDGQRIVTGGVGGTAKVWEAATVQEVAAWQAEEKADLERWRLCSGSVKRQHERALRAQDPGAIKQWLVLAPIPFQDQSGEGALKALDQEQVSPEPELRPRASDRVKVGASELVWNALRQEDYLLDFNQLLGKKTEWSVAYAVCYIQSEAARPAW